MENIPCNKVAHQGMTQEPESALSEFIFFFSPFVENNCFMPTELFETCVSVRSMTLYLNYMIFV